ncbi:uncharacterized protein EAF02_009079 [Botrytis sinoallii]|uniref:uncharacterized protein n=1 Tax=Botrytis sinoallii TaxID=1463999 RepID=UPI001901A76D|nr:uncharacterized protein EAF02_009079 [Botrytis sinoallii]KAF7871974.1 hypothetical protein EAF02_009079 [Botrytis sinoallii]
MDPVSIITLTGSVFNTRKVITSLITSLVTLKSKYKNASLIASLLIGQLTTIKTALNEVLLWNESEIKELNNYLNSQVNALHLLLTAVQRHVSAISNTKQSLAIKICYLNCVKKQNSRTSFNRNQLLQKPESQKVFKRVEDDRSSVSAFRSRSGTSAETSGSQIAFDFDKEIATTDVYRNVTASPEMTGNGSENTSVPRARKKTGTKMSFKPTFEAETSKTVIEAYN